MMAKHWTSGRVKTRLGMSIGNEAAAHVHETFCVHLCNQLGGVSARRQVALDPASQIVDVEKRLNASAGPDTSAGPAKSRPMTWEVVPQSEGDLGERMLHWFEQLATQASDSSGSADEIDDRLAILIGADCPLVSPHSIDRAVSHLSRNDVVVGPALDGGYYLIGMRLESLVRSRNLFSNVPWSTDEVLSCTLRSAHRMGLAIGMLEPRHDVDTIDDLNRLRRTLRASDRPEHVALDQRLNQIVGETIDDDGASDIGPESIRFE